MTEETREIITEAAKRLGSYYAIHKRLGVAYSTVHAWKKGTAEPQARHLLKLIELAGKSVRVVAGATLISLALPYGSDDAQAGSTTAPTHQAAKTLCIM